MADHRTVSEDDLARLKREREDADRRYNDALTALDKALQRPGQWPHPPPLPDETQVTPLNAHWDLSRHKPALPGGWRGRLARFVWSLVEPSFEQQRTFNAALVDHVNRSVPGARAVPHAIESILAMLQQHVQQQLHFQSQLIVYLQQLTPYVDSKDYEFAGIARRITEDARDEIDRLDDVTRALAGSLSGVSDAMLKRWESLAARDQRYGGRIDELRASIDVAQQQLNALKRAVDERPSDAPRPAAASSRAVAATPVEAADGGWKYVGFENLFRGSQDEIRRRLEPYLATFDGARDVVDVGCGRGEFLELLAGRGIRARGIDVNADMVATCRERGLDVSRDDAVSFLRSQPDESLGGVIATQVVEHLEPPYLLQFLEHAHRALRPGAAIVLETINAACWVAFFESYLRDITHARALHPDTLKYLVMASGFADAQVVFSAPVAAADRLQPSPRIAFADGDSLVALAETFDANVERLNRLLFTHMDFAVIARRPGGTRS
jgi:2-polyprenyl-3-methyl-5-hydroxy-6-metoxy-1,4-benzoquinol methylase